MQPFFFFFFLCVQKEKMKQKYKIYEKLDLKPEKGSLHKGDKKKKKCEGAC